MGAYARFQKADIGPAANSACMETIMAALRLPAPTIVTGCTLIPDTHWSKLGDQATNSVRGGYMRRSVAFSCAILWIASLARAQAPTGEITGTVIDPSGAAVADVTI